MQEWNKQVYLYSTDIAKFGFIAKLVLAAELNRCKKIIVAWHARVLSFEFTLAFHLHLFRLLTSSKANCNLVSGSQDARMKRWHWHDTAVADARYCTIQIIYRIIIVSWLCK